MLVGATKRLTFPVVVEPADLTVPADPDRLHQVVANLLHNAVRHSPEDDEVRLEARLVGTEVRIDVVDHGPGISREQRPHVFERFVRGNNPAVTGQVSTGGTGLGARDRPLGRRAARRAHRGRRHRGRLHDAGDPAGGQPDGRLTVVLLALEH